MPENASRDVDWDAVVAMMHRALYNGERVDVLDMRIPYTAANISYILNTCWFNPMFLRTSVSFSSAVAEGDNYIAAFNAAPATAAVYRERYDDCMDAIDTLMYGVKDDPGLSLLDKCLIIQDRLCVWSEYDYINYLASESGDGVIPQDSYSAYGPLVLRTGVCNGIALAYGWMLDILGVENYMTISGTINHAWNMAYLDGEPYYVDVTWNDPVWDVPGYVLHPHFFVSFNTFSASHGASDFSDEPTSTLYEVYFSKTADSQILYINGYFYYVRSSNGITVPLVKRDPATGEETTVLTLNQFTGIDGAYVHTPPRLLQIGNDILYLAGREVRVYHTDTGADEQLYVPAGEPFASDPLYVLMGIRQRDGEVTVYYYTKGTYNSISTETPEVFVQCVTDFCESFSCCTHDNMTLLEQLPGETCLVRGKARMICPDCGFIEYVDGQGVFGDHDYTAETANQDTFAFPATCAEPDQYYYSCVNCGLPERNPDHTFSYGEALPHPYQTTIVDATPTCPGYSHNVCPDCGNVSRSDFTFYPGYSAGSVADGAFGWQIVNGVLSVCGLGALPDYTADTYAPWYDYSNSVTSLVVNDGITSVGEYAFRGLNKMTAMTLTDDIETIGAYAFSEASGLTDFVMPASLLRIGGYAFESATSLESITNNDCIREIGTFAFCRVYALKSIVIPGSIRALGFCAFAYCYNCESVVVEEGSLTELPTFFWFGSPSSDSKVEEFRLPSNILTISANCSLNSLSDCRRITVAEDNPQFRSSDGVLYSKNMETLIKYPGCREGEYYEVPPPAKMRAFSIRNAVSVMPPKTTAPRSRRTMTIFGTTAL